MVSKQTEKLMIKYLKKRGIKNPLRTKRLIGESIKRYGLDLKGLTILTEAASGNFVFTPVIAAVSGAEKVYAVSGDSRYGRAEDVEKFVYSYADFCGVKDRIEIMRQRKPEIIGRVDVVTNLGFVRPIDKELIGMLKGTAAVTLMCEAWEYRKGDIDLGSCAEKGIPVMGVNESVPGKEIFDFCGNLCMKMLFEAEIEVYKSRIAIAGMDKFGKIIEKYLRNAGAETAVFDDLRKGACRKFLKDADVLVVADYTGPEIWVGKNGHISAGELFSLSQGISVIQFCGNVDVEDLDEYGITHYPDKSPGSHRMALTLAELGPRPVIDLHCAGLKVGEAMARAKLDNLPFSRFVKRVCQESPAMPLEEGVGCKIEFSKQI